MGHGGRASGACELVPMYDAMMKRFAGCLWITACLALAGCTAPTAPGGNQALAATRYQVTFQATWSATTHPDPGFPAVPHFSGLIGATHLGSVRLWQEGMTASDGVKNMAELGSKSPLDAEIQAVIAQGLAQVLLSGGSIDVSPGTVTLDFDITPEFPFVTLVAMVAPSPDWFVGVSALALVQNGAWVELLSVDLFPYDAGTDGGTTYLAADVATIPRDPIARITGAPFLVGGAVPALGTFTFRRIGS